MHECCFQVSSLANQVRCREIIDESDVYIDVHKAIRRMAPAPKARYQRRSSQSGRVISDGIDGKSSEDTKVGEEDTPENDESRDKRFSSLSGNEQSHARDRSGSPMTSTLLLRRSSAGIDGRLENVPVRASFNDIKQHLKHLGPSNPASNPKVTRSTTVKIKPGIVVHEQPRTDSVAEQIIPEVPQDEENGETTSLLRGKVTPKDGVHALATSYGATGAGLLSRSLDTSRSPTPLIKNLDTTNQEDQATQTSIPPSTTDLPGTASARQELRSKKSSSGKSSSGSETDHLDPTSPYGHRKSLFARSGSITEQVVETRGIKKTVLEMTSSNEDEEEQTRTLKSGNRSNLSLPSMAAALSPDEEGENEENGSGGPSTPLLGGEEGAGAGSTGGTQNGGGNGGGGKKKNRRKKRKGKS